MTSPELWAIFAAKNPKLSGPDDSTVTLTVRGLRKLFDQAYDQGHTQGVANGRALAAKEKPPERPDLFNEIFRNGNSFKP